MLSIMILLGVGAKSVWFGKRTLDFSGEKKVVIRENGYAETYVLTNVLTLAELIEEQGLKIAEEDLIFPAGETKLYPGMTVTIQRAVPVEIAVDGGTVEKKVLSRKIKDALAEAGVVLSHLDKIDPGKDEPVVAGAKIEVTRIEVEEVTKQEKIDFEMVEQEDKDLRWRKKEVKQEGVEGIKETTYRITYKNGKQDKKEKLSSKIIQEPVREIVRVGTKVEVGKTKEGVASWYRFKGGMFCASRMWPRGTWLRVTNQENGKQIFVQVNDYGPQRGTGKMIDLDAVAFEKLAPLGKGVIGVKVEEILE